MHNIEKLLTTIASTITIGFGIWHFAVPKIWDWYSFIDPNAPELILAVRAINIFFSLSLVLFGINNILLLYLNYANSISIIIALSLSTILWITRVVFQIIYPQGSEILLIQYAMLFTFIFVTVLYIASLGLFVYHKNVQ